MERGRIAPPVVSPFGHPPLQRGLPCFLPLARPADWPLARPADAVVRSEEKPGRPVRLVRTP